MASAARSFGERGRQGTLRAGLHFRFELCGKAWRLEVAAVERVVAWAELRPSTDPELLGWLQLYAEAIPVVDGNRLLGGPATEPTLGARILVVRCAGAGGTSRLVGVLVSRLYEVVALPEVAGLERFSACDLLAARVDALVDTLVDRLP